MLEQSRNARNKQDAAWRQSITSVEYKAELYSRHVNIMEAEETPVETARPTDTGSVSAKRVIEAGGLGVVRKTQSSVMLPEPRGFRPLVGPNPAMSSDSDGI